VFPFGRLAGMSIADGMDNFSLAAMLVAALSIISSRLHPIRVAAKKAAMKILLYRFEFRFIFWF
jgi:hypothetical protein